MGSRKDWENLHQPFELRYHRRNNVRWNDGKWADHLQRILSGFMELTPDHFAGDEVLLDLGCGSRPSVDWFTGGIPHCLDPLLDDFTKIKRMQRYWKDKPFMYSKPAEVLVQSLAGKCDFVYCWNVLDHAHDWRQIIKNIGLYLKDGGLACVGTDLNKKPSRGHPGIDSDEDFFGLISKDFQTVKRVDGFHYRDVALKLVRC